MSALRQRIRDVMQTEVVTLGLGDHLDLVEDIMRLGRVRHMPVVDEGRVVGIVSSRDLLAASLSQTLGFDKMERRTHMRSVDVGEVMTRELISVAPDATLAEAAALMVERKVGCLPVLKPDATLVGLVTETDLLRATLLTAPEDEEEINPEEAQAMTDVGDRIEEELEGLRRTRDELRVKVHLAKADARDLWDKLENKFDEAEAKVKFVAKQAEEPLQDVRDAARLLLTEIRDGYRQIRDAL